MVSASQVYGLAPAVYAIVESASYSTDQAAIDMSDIFVPVTKEVGNIAGGSEQS
jgi:hypothetical protein